MNKGVSKTLAIGVDIGGTKVETALVNGEGEILYERRYPTNPEKGSEGIVADIITAVGKLIDIEGHTAQAVGVGVAGQVESTGVVRSAPNLPFKNEPLQDRLEKELGVPVVVTNDVRAATFGEWQYGSGKGVDDMVVVFVGTGIGGGVISGGRMIEGCTNTGGELGHITLVADGRRCRCPNLGCLEAYAGGWAIAERAREAASKKPKEGERLVSVAGHGDAITAATVSEGYREKDPLSLRLVEETGQYLATGLVGIVNVFNPCLLVLGGGVIEGIPDMIGTVESVIRRRALTPGRERLKIVKAALGGTAGVIGAAALARSRGKL